MIKASADTESGRKLLIIGLSEANLKRLREGKPIIVHGEEWGQGFDLTIFWGETEEAMAKMLKPYMGGDTVIIDTTKKQRN